jgi:hypothetical protein
MRRVITQFFAAIAISICSLGAFAQDALPYTEGAVVIVTSVRTQPGKFNEYFRYLSGPYSRIMDEAKKAGVLTSYSFVSATPRSPDDPDLYIVETYPNMAVFDTLTDKMTVISSKVFGSIKQADEADANRESVRKILGSEMLRELMPVKK